jgi:hypothetical protein
LKLLEARGSAVRRVVVLGGAGLSGRSRIRQLSAAEVASPGFPARMVELLGGEA